MDYQKKLNEATSLLLIQIAYNEAFEKATQRMEESFRNENVGQQLVYKDGSIDMNLGLTDFSLLLSAEYRAVNLFGKKKNTGWIRSNLDSFVSRKQNELTQIEKKKI